MKLSTWAKQIGIPYQTAYTWFKQGKLPMPSIQIATGSIYVQPEKSTVFPEDLNDEAQKTSARLHIKLYQAKGVKLSSVELYYKNNPSKINPDISEKYLIYGLRDPITEEIRYVGRSSSGLTRPKSHYSVSSLNSKKGAAV